MESTLLAPADQLGTLGVAHDDQTDVHKYTGRLLWRFRYLKAKAYVKNVGKAIVRGPLAQQVSVTPPCDTWSVNIGVAHGRKDEYRTSAHALFDSQSRFDLISTRCAARLGLNFDKATREPLAKTITGHVIHKVGEMKARWYCGEVVRSSFSDSEIECLHRVEEVRFHVVDSEYFDVIIGHPTMEELDIYGRKQSIVAPFFRPLGPNVAAPPSVTAAQQSAADRAIEEERLRMEQDEIRRAQDSSGQ